MIEKFIKENNRFHKKIKMIPSSLDYFKTHEPQVFSFWPTLTDDQKLAFEHQLRQIDLMRLEEQRQLLQTPLFSLSETFEVFDDFVFSGNRDNQLLGQRLIEEGRVGCLLLAGGQGTRLQFNGPKGTYPLSMIKHKSLFQLCAEKVKAASKKAQCVLKLALMTSVENDQETRFYFEKNHYFGLHPSQVSFFVQETLPLLDAKGALFLQTPWQISSGANGNGNSLLQFAHSGILNQWLQQGIDYLNVILVDNPLADPFDAELIGFHHQQAAEITLKCTEKLSPTEKVGVLTKHNGHCRVVEYSEMSEKEKNERTRQGRLKHCCANLSLFCFSLSFVQQMASTIDTLSLHQAWKTALYVDEKGHSRFSHQPIAWKFETFIFDWLMYTSKISALIYPREECFAPLKNRQGVDSPETVQHALQARDRKVIQSLTGLPYPLFPFELAADFYYPTPVLCSKWQKRPITTSYVDP